MVGASQASHAAIRVSKPSQTLISRPHHRRALKALLLTPVIDAAVVFKELFRAHRIRCISALVVAHRALFDIALLHVFYHTLTSTHKAA